MDAVDHRFEFFAALGRIVEEAREQLRALRASGLPPDQLRARMGAARQQTDRRIAALLKPEQMPGWEAWRAQRNAAATVAAAQGRVHVLDADGTPRAIAVRLGIGDGSVTEILGEGLAAGQELVVGGGPRAPAASATAALSSRLALSTTITPRPGGTLPSIPRRAAALL